MIPFQLICHPSRKQTIKVEPKKLSNFKTKSIEPDHNENSLSLQKIALAQPIEPTSKFLSNIPEKGPNFVKRDSETKARRKRILRRIAKGKPVQKGILKHPPKNLETRLHAGVALKVISKNHFKFAGKSHTLDVNLVYIGSAEDLNSRAESLKIYRQYQAEIHGDNIEEVGERQWKRFLLDNPFQDEQKRFGTFHCQYRLDGT